MIGSGCSVATEPTAEVSHYYNITHVRKYTLSVVISSTIYLLWTTYSRKFLREKTFSNSAVLWLFAKFGIVASFGMAKASNPQRFSRWNRIFLQIHESFLPRKFPAISYLLSIEVSSLVKVQEDRFTQWSLFFFTLFGLSLCWLLWLYLRDFLQITFKGYSSWSLGHSSGGLAWGLVGGPVVRKAWETFTVQCWQRKGKSERSGYLPWHYVRRCQEDRHVGGGAPQNCFKIDPSVLNNMWYCSDCFSL